MTIAVCPLSPSRETAYREFLSASPDATLYSSLEYRDFLASIVPGVANYLVAYDEASRVIGALPLFAVEAPGIGRLFNSLPWYGSHGGCVLSATSREAARTALLDEFARVIADDETLSATLVLLPSEEPHVPSYLAVLGPVAEDHRIGQVTLLPEDGADVERRLEARLLRKTRNLVRKALRQGFTVTVRDDDDAWAFLHSTHTDNLSAIGGMAKPASHFAALRTRLPQSIRRLYVGALDDGQPVAALLLASFGATIEYITPVVVQRYRHLQPLSAVIFQAMLDGVRQGCRTWNWGGTWQTQSSLYHFKRGWGAEDRPYRYLIRSRDAGRRLAEVRSRLSTLFPYYYAFPYAQLQ